MAFVWAGLRLVRFGVLRRLLDGFAGLPTRGNPGPPDPDAIRHVRWAVTAVATRVSSATCLVQALAADVMLRRRGLACELRIGVRAHPASVAPLEAHAWIECGGAVAIGRIESLQDFKVLITRVAAE